MTLLDGRVAFVTGGSSGIGRGISIEFAEQGADVGAGVREEPEEGGRPTHEAIAAGADASAEFVECDVSEVEASKPPSRWPTPSAAWT